jgi:hypothetical protein
MNMKTFPKNLAGFIAAVAVVATLNTIAAGSNKANPYFATLSKATQMELPGKTAALVAKAEAKQQKQTTIDAVTAAVGLNPAAAPAIVGSVAQSVPEMAPVAASTAVSLVPNQASAIARVAAAAAPKQAGKIVEAVCRVTPQHYKEIASAVAEVAPGQSRAILAGVAAAVPALKDSINQMLAAPASSTVTVAAVLDQAQPSTEFTSLSAAPRITIGPPVIGPPYVPPPNTHTNIDPGGGNQIPDGGRGNDYSAPPTPPEG